MPKQKRGFLLFICSLIPGAGEMYLGFFKQGISIMTLFWAIVAIAGGFSAEFLVIFLPVIWFYSYFHVHNLKELPEEELKSNGPMGIEDDKLSFKQTVKLLFENKYFSMICVIYILQQLRAAMVNVGIFFMTYVLLNKNLFGVFSWANNIPLIIALAITPMLVAKANGMYKLNKYSYVFASFSRLLVVFAGYMGSIPLMLLFIAMTSLGEGPWQGDMSAVIAQCSEYTYLKSGKPIDGSMFSCTSMGIKLGGGIGIALSGWLLDISGYINMDNAVQPASCIKMMYFMYLWLPFIFDIIITVILSFLNVEGANRELIENMQEL